MSDENTKETLASWMLLALEPDKTIGPAPVVKMPADARLESMEPYLDKPVRIRSKDRVFRDVESFVEYVQKFKLPETAMFEKEAGNSIWAVLDFHGDAKHPNWCDHAVALALKFSPIFEKWQGLHGKMIGQEPFAEFLEMNALGIVKPDAATVLEAARSLQAVQRVDFQSGVRTSNGDVQFTYAVNTTATVGQKGKLDVPESFEICCPIFQGQSDRRMPARLFWRIGDDKRLTFRVMIPQLDQIVEDAREAVRDEVEEITGITVWRC